MHKKNYLGFPSPDKIITKKNSKILFKYLDSFQIEKEFDVCVFLHQVRASRPVRSFNFLRTRKLARISVKISSDFKADLSQGDKSLLLWKDVYNSCNFILGCFKKQSTFDCKNINDLIATHILSEFLEYPIFCYWETDCFSQDWLKTPSILQRFFPWESQLCINICNNALNKKLLLERGLNPALVVDSSEECCEPNYLIKKLCSASSVSLAEKYLKLPKKNNSKNKNHLLNRLFLRRPYLVGLNKLAYFSNSVSLINGMSFHEEEQIIRRIFFEYAQNYVINTKAYNDSRLNMILYHVIDSLFYLKSNNTLSVISDCSFAFRHRSRQDMKYAHFTEVELKGIINQIIHAVYRHKEKNLLCKYYKEKFSKIDEDYKAVIATLASNSLSKIDDSNQIIQKLNDVSIPLFCFIDGSSLESLVLSVINPLKNRIERKDISSPIYIFSSTQKTFINNVDHRLIKFIVKNDPLLKKSVECGLLKVIKTKQLTGGINLLQLGKKALKILYTHRKDGIICSFDEEGLITSNNLAIPWMSIGKICSENMASICGLEINEGYAIIHTKKEPLFMGFPVVNKSILDIRNASLNSKNSCDIVDKNIIIERIENETIDGSPISGFSIIISNIKKKYVFDVGFFSSANPLQKIIEKYESKNHKKVISACNGGYFLDERVIKSQNLPNTLLNSPLGLLKIGQKILSLPLSDNRPALTISQNGDLKIKILDLKKIGIVIKLGKTNYRVRSNQIDPVKFKKSSIILCTINKSVQKIPSGFAAIKFLFNEVIEVLKENQISQILIPSYTLLIPLRHYFDSCINSKISFIIEEYKNFDSMIEAGPLLIKNGKIAIDLKKERWGSPKSKVFLFSEIDFTKLRTARTAFCVLKNKKVAIVAINSRTVESVGSTHFELAKIIKEKFKNEVLDAMEFDSGGSVSLWAYGNLLTMGSTLNSSNKEICNLKYFSRPISTAILISAK